METKGLALTMKNITDIDDDALADTTGVDRFKKAMLAKLREKRAEGYNGWNRRGSAYFSGCSVAHLIGYA